MKKSALSRIASEHSFTIEGISGLLALLTCVAGASGYYQVAQYLFGGTITSLAVRLIPEIEKRCYDPRQFGSSASSARPAIAAPAKETGPNIHP